jgi:peptidyl-prolyl cis-trans isomerase A (cyclophilin A)
MKLPVLVAATLVALAAQATGPAPHPRVLFETEAGEFIIEVETTNAPLTAGNFLKYVDAGLYDGGRFHRTVKTTPDNQLQNEVKIDVIQAAANTERRREFLPPIEHEPTSKTKLTHTDGTVSMARAEIGTARDQFFICIGSQPALDEGGRRNPDGHGFAAFGRVIAGMETVRKIHGAPASGQNLTPVIRIIRARRQ